MGAVRWLELPWRGLSLGASAQLAADTQAIHRGEAWPALGSGAAPLDVQSSWAKMNAAKSTSRVSSTRRSSVETPGLNTDVHGSTSATSASPRVSAWTSFTCLPDEPRKMRGFMRGRVEGEILQILPGRDTPPSHLDVTESRQQLPKDRCQSKPQHRAKLEVATAVEVADIDGHLNFDLRRAPRIVFTRVE